MAEPKRLLEQLGSGLERDLLLYGSTERAPSGMRRRVEASFLGVAPVAAVVLGPEVAVSAGGAGASKTTALLATAAKWLAIGAFAGGALGGAAASVAGPQSEASPAALRELPSIRQLTSAASGMKTEKARLDSPGTARDSESKPQKPAARRPSGTVWIGPPALRVEQPRPKDLRDPNAPARASTSER